MREFRTLRQSKWTKYLKLALVILLLTSQVAEARVSSSAQRRKFNDNQKLSFGTAFDASISFDGDSLNIIANAITATDDIVFSSDKFEHSSGTFDLNDDNLTTTGTITAEQLTSTDDITMLGHLFTLGDGSATDIMLSFDGSAFDGTLTYVENADRFGFSSTVVSSSSSVAFITTTAAAALAVKDDSYAMVIASDLDTGMFFNASGAAIEFHLGGVVKHKFDIINGDYVSTGNITIGVGAAGIDYTLTFDGEDEDGVMTFMEDEDNFKFSGNIHVENDTIAVGRAPTINADIDSIKIHSATDQDQFAIRGFITQDTATAFTVAGMQSAALSTHTTGTIATLTGYTSNVQAQSSGDITVATGVSGNIVHANGAAPTMTLNEGFSTNLALEDVNTTFAFGIRIQPFSIDAGSAVIGIGVLAQEQTIASINWAIVAQGDVQLDSDNKLILEGTALGGDKGDSYLVFNSSTTDIDLFADNTQVMTWDNDLIDSHVDINMQENVVTNFGGLHMKGAVEETISNGAITITEGHVCVDTEAGAANDDLDTINSSFPGEILFLLPADDARTVRIRNGVGNIFLKHQVDSSALSFSSPAGAGAAIRYAGGGYYDFPTTDANLDQSAITQTLGTSNTSYAAHASLIAAGAGTATGGSGAVVIAILGTSIDDEANRVTSDTEVIVGDITAMFTDQYFETSKKWIGQITYVLVVGGTGHTAFAADFNYGFSKYEDFGNQSFTVTGLQIVGEAGANDTNFNMILFHHNEEGWTYAATGFVPGGTQLANMNTDHSTEQDLANGEPFAWKRTDLNTDIAGDNGEGTVFRIDTSSAKAVESMSGVIWVHTAPAFSYMSDTKQHLIFMKHGANWLEL